MNTLPSPPTSTHSGKASPQPMSKEEYEATYLANLEDWVNRHFGERKDITPQERELHQSIIEIEDSDVESIKSIEFQDLMQTNPIDEYQENLIELDPEEEPETVPFATMVHGYFRPVYRNEGMEALMQALYYYFFGTEEKRGPTFKHGEALDYIQMIANSIKIEEEGYGRVEHQEDYQFDEERDFNLTNEMMSRKPGSKEEREAVIKYYETYVVSAYYDYAQLEEDQNMLLKKKTEAISVFGSYVNLLMHTKFDQPERTRKAIQLYKSAKYAYLRQILPDTKAYKSLVQQAAKHDYWALFGTAENDLF